ncbi:MAG: hypothetical protein ACUVUD_01975 [bacterium]
MIVPEEEKKEQTDQDLSPSGVVFWQRPVFFIPGVIVLLLVLSAAVIVVIKNVGRVQLGPAPVTINPITPDTTMSRVRRQLTRGITRLEKRLYQYRGKIDTLTFYQESLYKMCSLDLKELRKDFAMVESARSYDMRKSLFTATRKRYVALRNMVNDFALSVDSAISGRVLDSLDREFQKLIGK